MKGRFVEEINKKKENKDLVGVRKPKKKAYEKSHTPKSQASARTRTEDLRITNAPLYQLSYTGTGREPVLGLEPRTCALRMRRSTN